MNREETLKKLNEIAEPLTPEMTERWEKRLENLRCHLLNTKVESEVVDIARIYSSSVPDSRTKWERFLNFISFGFAYKKSKLKDIIQLSRTIKN